MLQATVSEQDLMSEYTGVHTTLQSPAAPGTQRQQIPSVRSYYLGAEVNLPANGKRGSNSSSERHSEHVQRNDCSN